MAGTAAPNAVIVLGMHRSGTSAVAGALGVLGVNLGERLVQAQADNPKGYWEHADAVRLHERLFAALGSAWEDPRELPAGWTQTAPARDAAEAAAALIAGQFADGRLWALKDPRQCRLLPIWRDAFAAHDARPAFLFVLRDPDEVAASLRARDGIGAEHAALLWLRHVFEAEGDSADAPRVLLDYARLLADPVAALTAAGTELGVRWPRSPEACRAALGGFVDAGLRHQQGATPSAGPAARLARVTFARCLEAAHGGRWPELDDLRVELAALSAPADAVPGLVHALARDRAAFAAQESRLAETDRALGQASELSLQRLDELHALNARLERTDEALVEAQRLSIERMHQLEATDRALEETKQLSLARLAEIEAQTARAERAEGQVRAMEQSRSWRLTRPLRALAAWLARLVGRSDGA